MKITYLQIKNFRSIQNLVIKDIDEALILVGKNNVGKSIILDAIRAVSGAYQTSPTDFYDAKGNISVKVNLNITADDLKYLHKNGIVSKYKHYHLWEKDFMSKLPSYHNGILTFEFVYGRDGISRYRDGIKNNNIYIKSVFPKIYYIDHGRNRNAMQEDIMMLQGQNEIMIFKENKCIFDRTKKCNQCMRCIGYICQKKPEDLSLMETARLFQCKLISVNLNQFSEKLNRYLRKNGSYSEEIRYEIRFDVDEVFKIDTIVSNTEREIEYNILEMGEAMRSIYTLSLLEVYAEIENIAPYIIIIENPEIYLHPQSQRVASEILYKVSKKNQVLFSTHSPAVLFSFTTKQIRQVIVDQEKGTIIKPETDIDEILDDLGYTANDLMNVNFVFIVEGKQDRSRLPLLLEKYYSEIHNENGDLQRISIISTNSCTNIKTYANLKYINTLYLKDQFLMIRDGDGKDRKMLADQLCKYYEDRGNEDYGNIPRVTQRNVLILKYYSFENYFLDPKVMTQIGVVESEEQFYEILFSKFKEYLYKLVSVKKMFEATGIVINSADDIKKNMELIRIYVRGHNLYDIFYGKYRGINENDILKKYIDAAPKETFDDIFKAIDDFVYFDSRKRDKKEKKENENKIEK